MDSPEIEQFLKQDPGTLARSRKEKLNIYQSFATPELNEELKLFSKILIDLQKSEEKLEDGILMLTNLTSSSNVFAKVKKSIDLLMSSQAYQSSIQSYIQQLCQQKMVDFQKKINKEDIKEEIVQKVEVIDETLVNNSDKIENFSKDDRIANFSTEATDFSNKSVVISKKANSSVLPPVSFTDIVDFSAESSEIKVEIKEIDKDHQNILSKPPKSVISIIKRTFSCDICYKSFGHRGHLKDHMLVHTGDKPFQCEVCHMNFARLRSKTTHMANHLQDKPFKCDICHKGFGIKRCLTKHMKMHTGEKNYPCDVCKKYFVSNFVLKVHMRKHTGEKPYKCDQCFKMFSQNSSLTDHMRTHSGEKPFKCDQCTKEFSTKSILRKHLLSHTKR